MTASLPRPGEQAALALTDVIMPGIDGVELAERLRHRWPSLQVLFMSGYSTEALQQLMHLGPAGVLLQKPFTSEELLLRVGESLSAVAHQQPGAEG